jgi:hypothetical protein
MHCRGTCTDLDCNNSGQGQGQGYITTNSQSVSQYVLVFSPTSDYGPEFAFSLKFNLDSP